MLQVVKKVNKIIPSCKKEFNKIFSKHRHNKLTRNFLYAEFGIILHELNCRAAQQCTEFGASAWEGVQHSGWEFSILASK